ncbi:MAG: response regulator [Burkholderiaceae bacterium]|nr:response regulator [Burkholderiaceae bacterium]
MNNSTAKHAPPPKVLVADDSVAVRRTVALLLTKMGYSGVLVADGEAALECLSKRQFDLLLLDLSMPKLDGLQVLASIRRAEAAGRGALRQRIVMITGYAEANDQARLLAAGADGYIGKPIDSVQFMREVQRVLHNQ